MKYRTTRTPKRTRALFLALNWYLTDQEDRAKVDEYQRTAESEGPWYSQDELCAALAQQYAGRFRTARLRRKRGEDLYWLSQSHLLDRFKEANATQK